jgi:hypothetical protein
MNCNLSILALAGKKGYALSAPALSNSFLDFVQTYSITLYNKWSDKMASALPSNFLAYF